MLSVNQVHAQIKLLEIWKAVNIEGNPIKVTSDSNGINTALTRSGGNLRLVESGRSNLCSKTFINDAIRIWNSTPSNIKEAKSLYSVKKSIKEFVTTLPF